MSKKQQIVDAARKRFRYYGIGKTTMQEIAQDAGVAVGTLYLYFSNKDALVVACAEEYVEHHRRQAEEILAAKTSPEEKLRAYVVDRFRQAEATRSSSRHAAEITRAVLRVKPDRIVEETAMMLARIGRILQLGVDAGRFHIADVQRDAQVFLVAIAAFFPNALAEPPVVPREEDLLMMIDWFVGVWKRTAGAKKRPRSRARSSKR